MDFEVQLSYTGWPMDPRDAPVSASLSCDQASIFLNGMSLGCPGRTQFFEPPPLCLLSWASQVVVPMPCSVISVEEQLLGSF